MLVSQTITSTTTLDHCTYFEIALTIIFNSSTSSKHSIRPRLMQFAFSVFN